MLFPEHEEHKQWFHCAIHWARLLRTKKGYLCPEGCGFVSPAVRVVMVNE